MKGDSLRRQLELSDKYTKDNNLVLDDKLNLRDLGVSAYSGANIEKGALGEFIRAIKEGIVEKGSYLLVESLDRISRKNVHEALRQFLNILDCGVTVVTLADGMKYEPNKIKTEELIISIFIMSRAHEESATKSKRLNSAWTQKRINSPNKKLTSMCPAWMSLDKGSNSFVLDLERVEVIKNIFQWTIDGFGTNLVISKLEKLGVKPWGLTEKRKAKEWYPSYIQKILNNPAVIGEYHPRVSRGKNQGEVYYDYYPRIVSDEIFYKANKARKTRASNGGGRKGDTFSNLFSKLAFCGYSLDSDLGIHRCLGNNQVMRFINKGNKSLIKYLQCSRIKDGHSGCDECKRMWRYDHFELSFLTHVKEVDSSILFFSNNDIKKERVDLENKIETLNGKISFIDKGIDNIKKAINEVDQIPKFMIDQGNILEDQRDILIKELLECKESILIKNGEHLKSDDQFRQLHDLINLMGEKTGDELFNIRTKLSELLKKVIDRIEVYSKGHILSAWTISNLYSTFNKEDVDNYLIEDKKSKSAFFIVRYKTGHSRYVFPVPNKPKQLVSSIYWDENKNIIDSCLIKKSDRLA